LEQLEDRLAPSTVSWNAAVSGIWTDGSKWSSGAPPAASDTVVIDKTGSAYTVTLDADATVAGFTLNSASAGFSLTSRTLTVNGPATLQAGGVTLNNSTWAGTGTLTNDASIGIQNTSVISSPFVQTSNGYLGLASYNANFDPSSENAFLTATGSFSNAGTIMLSGSGARTDVDAEGLTVANGGTLTNTGTINCEPAGTHTIAANLINNGTVHVDGANTTFGLPGDATTNSITNNGTFSIAASATLTLSGGGAQTFTQAGGTLDIEGTLTLPVVGPSGSQAGPTCAVTGGTVTGAGSFTLIKGVLTFNDSTDTTGPAFVLDNATLVMGANGTGKATFAIRNNCTLASGSFAAGQTVDIASYNANFDPSSENAFLTATGSFSNAGTITLSGSGARTDVDAEGLTVANGGTLTNTGTINCEPAGTHTLTANLINSGTVTVDTTVGTVTGNYTQTASGVLTATIGGTDPDTYSHLTISGTVALDGTLNTALANSFTPQPGQTFQIMSSASAGGTFARQTGAGNFRPIYNSPYVTLLALAPSTPPTATFASSGAVNEGSTGTVSFAKQTDSSPADVTAGFHYAYDFNNDGNFTDAGEIGDGTYAGSSTAASATVPAGFLDHGPGTYTVRGRIIDQGGAFTDYTTTITTNAVAPTATFTSGGTVTVGSAGSVSFASQSHPSAFETAAGFHYAYNFDNNGTFDAGDGTYAGSLTSASASVTGSFLQAAGTHTIRGRIIDQASNFTDYTATITVTSGTATHFALSAPSNAQPGLHFPLTVTALDQYGNTATGYTGTAQATSSDPTAFSGFVQVVRFQSGDKGQQTINVTLSTVGTQTVTATDTTTTTITGTASVLVAPNGPATFTVTNTSDSGPGSLRQAILDANAHPNGSPIDKIAFKIPGTGPQTIHVGAGVGIALPQVSDPVVIDGTTQPGFAGIPLIVLDGSGAGASANGLDVAAGVSTIRGLAIDGFGGCGIVLEQLTSDLVQGNYLGIDAVGRPAGSGTGIRVLSDLNTIGGTTAATRNVISANTADGVDIAGAVLNTVEGNFLGTDPSGTHAIGNIIYGVHIHGGARSNTIGGNVAGARNVISGNGTNGVFVDSDNGTSSNVIEGNFIGTDVLGTHPVPNPYGVVVYGGGNTIGGTIATARNIISGNSNVGIWLGNGVGTDTVEGNFIGTDVLGTHPLPNLNGVAIFAQNDIVGGTSPATRNVVSGNSTDGVIVLGGSANALEGNFIGTDVSGARALGNTYGVVIAPMTNSAATNNTVGGTTPSARNLISGNTKDGVQLNGTTTTGNLVEGNFIGTDLYGKSIVKNGLSGVAILSGASGNTVGGPTTVPGTSAGNLITGNGDGVYIGGLNNFVEGNLIGTYVNGAPSPGNRSQGVEIVGGSTGNTIGGTDVRDRNVISDNQKDGVRIGDAATTGNLVEGNLIGTDITGTLPQGNQGDAGVAIDGAAHNTVGGAMTGAGNVISGNRSIGVYLLRGAANNLVHGNLIGTDVSGANPLSNTWGVVIRTGATGNTIGGPAPGSRNIISGNTNDGVELIDEGTTGNLVQGDFIGTDRSGKTIVKNGKNGVAFLGGGATGNTIGGLTDVPGTGAGNLITGNGDGVYIADVGNFVEGNLIGTDISGAAVPGTGPGNSGQGVEIGGGSNSNVIGGTDTRARNIISGNGASGVRIADAGTTENDVWGNYIGTDKTGTKSLGNNLDGVDIVGAMNNLIGGAMPGAGNLIAGNNTNVLGALNLPTGNGVTIYGAAATGNLVQGNTIGDVTGAETLYNTAGVLITNGANHNTIGGTTPAARNVISGNRGSGVRIDSLASDNIVEGNYIGTDPSGTRSAEKQSFDNGVDIVDAPRNTIGGTAAGAGNLISGTNSLDAVEIEDRGTDTTVATGNKVQGNLIGTDASGTYKVPNSGSGVAVVYADGNTIGGIDLGARNVVSGNMGWGILLFEGSQNLMQGNFIGTDLAGVAPLPNALDGVSIIGFKNSPANQNTVGGGMPGAANVISANTMDGVRCQGYGTGNQVQGNLIGTDATGAFPLPNGQNGVEIQSSSNTIGGPDPGDGNVISGNAKDGVLIGSGGKNSVAGNLIGTDASGTSQLGNTASGVEILSGGNTIGGTPAGAGNVISGNGAFGVRLAGSNATGNQVLGNFIGTDVTQSLDLGNLADGVLVTASAQNNTIGAPFVGGNTIAFNHLSGVFINAGSSGNVVSGNAIFGNHNLGIALNGPTANNDQPAPVLTSLVVDPGAQSATVQGTIAGTVGASVTLEFFANAQADSVQGRRFLGSYLLKIPSDHRFKVGGIQLGVGEYVTATATDANSNTSAFSGGVH
jgi:hypothetical protein